MTRDEFIELIKADEEMFEFESESKYEMYFKIKNISISCSQTYRLIIWSKGINIQHENSDNFQTCLYMMENFDIPLYKIINLVRNFNMLYKEGLKDAKEYYKI